MPKLYFDGGWQLPGKQSREAKRVDVPNVPGELVDWLNARQVNDEPGEAAAADPFHDMSEEEAATYGVTLITAAPTGGDPARCSKCSRILTATLTGARKLAIGDEVEQVEAWIAELGEPWALQRIADAIADRNGKAAA